MYIIILYSSINVIFLTNGESMTQEEIRKKINIQKNCTNFQNL